jgi:transposase-like protein
VVKKRRMVAFLTQLLLVIGRGRTGTAAAPSLKPTSVDETYIRVKGHWCYLYRATDSIGATIDFLLSALCDAAAAKRLFRMALSDPSHPQPRVINTDKARLYGSAIAAVKAERTLRRRRHRPVQYLNNILEQYHRAIKRRVAEQSSREFRAAERTIAGYEAIRMIRKGQARWVSAAQLRQQNQFTHKLFDIPPETSPPSSAQGVLRPRLQSCNTSYPTNGFACTPGSRSASCSRPENR